MLVVASRPELEQAAGPVWGTGGWDPPETREARDWLCLARFCGWDVRVASDARGPASSFIVWTGGSPGALATNVLAARLETEPLLVVARAGEVGSAWARLAGAQHGDAFTGRELRLAGGRRAWTCATPVPARALTLDGAEVAASLDGPAIAGVRPVGQGAVLTLGFEPSAARDADGAVTAMLRELLVAHALRPVAWLDWSGTLVLRMDDPGSAESAYRAGWRYPKLGREAWSRIGDELRRRDARLSAAYVPAFVDDGDPARGRLEVAGRPAKRRAGAVHPSRAVRYTAPDLTWDGADEHAGLLQQQALGTIDIQLHGHTHVHPDRHAWSAAADRYESERWYRDLVVAADDLPDDEHPLTRGIDGLVAAFEAGPRALVCPGDAWTVDALKRALRLGFDVISSYYLALQDDGRWVWCQHICAPYLDTADRDWFAAELPVIGYFHDMELSVYGTEWLTEQLDKWVSAGARRMIGLDDLAAALDTRLSFDGERLDLGPVNGCPVPVRTSSPQTSSG
jgi:hypothetical protein